MQREIVEGYRLSPQQRRLWLLQQADHGLPYRAQCGVLIDGELDVKLLESVIQHCVDRLEILRTAFHQLPEMTFPVQVITEGRVSLNELEDLSGCEPAELEGRIEAILERRRELPVDFEQAPLLDASLARLSPREHLLILGLPALCADAVGLQNLMLEIGRSYQGLLRGEEPADNPSQYVDISEWFNELLESEETRAGRENWQKHYDPALLNLRLPFEQQPQFRGGFRPKMLSLTLDSERRAGVEEAARTMGCSVENFLQACWHALLWHLTRQASFIMGCAFANRKYEELGGALGLFARYLPIECRVDGADSFDELVRRVAEVRQQAYEWQEYFSPDYIEESSFIGADPAYFAVCFDFEDRNVAYRADEASFSIYSQYTCFDRFKIRLCSALQNDSLLIELHYDGELVPDSDIERLAGQLDKLIESVLQKPQAAVAELSILTDSERYRLLVDFNLTAEDYPKESCFHHLFEQQAARAPENPAVSFRDHVLSYRELNARSNRLAHRLRKLGVGPDVLVGVCMERSPEMLAAILGTLKAGGAYVPLDASYPKERLEFMIGDAQTAVLLTQERLLPLLPREIGKPICLDLIWDDLAGESDFDPVADVTGANLAYVMYTSGSTGRPKGVMVHQQGLVNYLSWCIKEYNLTEGRGALVHSPLAFDLTVTSLFAPLAAGRQVELLPDEPGLDGLVQALQSRGDYSLLKVTPSHLNALAYQLSGRDVEGKCRTLIIGGEALFFETITAWSKFAPETRVFNEYGPTEAVVGCSVYRDSGEEGRAGAVPIGRPIANAQLYVLDAKLEPVPMGVIAGLYIGGDGLARGYHRRPDLTAEAFIPNPFSNEPGARLYRTGDLARHMDDGNLEFIGRKDHQVKIRGYRIELGEVESALLRHPAVREAAVIAHEEEAGDRRLVAYVVADRRSLSSIAELRSFAQEKLPEYMMPSLFMMMESLPLTQNGKVDIEGLPAPDYFNSESRSAYVPPITLAEEVLTEIWADILGTENVSIDDNFFSLGGDSIRSIQVLARAEERGLHISHQQLFQYQTVRKLAREVSFAESGPAVIAKAEPFSLISKEDLLKLPEGLEDAYPLSFLQAGMVFHTELSSDAPVFHDMHITELQAPLDIDVLRSAAGQLMTRHAVLRTALDLSHFSQPLQLVYRNVEVPLSIDDLRHLSREEQDRAITEWVEYDKTLTYDWEVAPLLRFHIHLRSDDTFQFTMSFHHAILDGWSAASLLTNLFRTYLYLMEDRSYTIEPLEVAFRDFIMLEQNALKSGEAKQYWDRKMSDAVITNLPRWGSARPNDASAPRVHLVEVPISPEVSESLKRLARSKSVPIKTVLFSAHLRVISLLTGHPDVITGFTSNGRPEVTDGEKVIGLFLNTLPFRMKLTGGAWEELIQQTFETERELLPFRWYPMARIQQDQGGKQLFETAFNFIHYHVYEGLQNIQGNHNASVINWTAFEQTNFTMLSNFSMDLDSSQVRLILSFDDTQLAIEQMEAIGRYFENALVAMAADPKAQYENASLLTSEERQQILAGWNDTAVEYDQIDCVHQLFEQQARSTPHNIALSFGNNHLTYRELDRRANQLARYLIKLGVGPESRVGICLRATEWMMVAVLGVMKAGGAYVPLDRKYPMERLALMVEEAEVRAIISESELIEELPSVWVEMISVDEQREEIERESGEGVSSGVRGEGVAYVIYTSGSTGRPKGVMVEHRGVVNYLRYTSREYDVGEGSGSPVYSPITFDLVVTSLFAPLLAGRKVVLLPEAPGIEPLLAALEAEETFSFIKLTPTHLEMVSREVSGETIAGRALSLVIGGEALKAETISFWETHSPQTRIYNEYGPTETVVGCSVYEVPRDHARSGALPIGRPIANTRLYVLDSHLQPVPVGVTSELYVGGAGVGRGYVNRPELTAELFIPDPFSEEPGARLYRTGDRARFRPDGNLEFFGRIDHQVKIHGYRIELGEIEAEIARHRAVRGVVVDARDDANGIRMLVAYVALNEGDTLNATELRAFLQEKLPDYMLPSVVVELDEIPLTPSGKVDRRGLPAPEFTRPSLDQALTLPRTPSEELLAAIWSQVLGIEKVGIHDNFFDLGGHSLQATQVIVRVRDAFNLELGLRSLFDLPTIASLAQLVDESLQARHSVEAPPIKAVSRDRRLPLSFAQQRLWFVNQLDPNNPAYNQPAAIRVNGRLDEGALKRTFDEIVRRHEVLRTVFPSVDGQPFQEIRPAAPVHLPVVDLTALPDGAMEGEIGRLNAMEVQRPFDLATGPLLRITLLKAGEQYHVVLLTMHHIISDAWSMGVFVREVGALYEAFSSGVASPLPELPVQYADYAYWQQEWLQGEVLDRHLDYWKKQLDGAPQSIRLGNARPAPGALSFRGASHSWLLPPELAGRLRLLSQKEGATLYMTLLAAFNVWLHHYSGEKDIVVGTDVANRNRREAESLIGFFINQIVLRTDLSGDSSFRQLLARVRRVSLDAYSHQDLPFEKLVESINPERYQNITPLFQVKFIFQNTPVSTLDISGITISPLGTDTGMTKFDLSLFMMETDQGLAARLEYRADLFDPSDVEQMAENFNLLLDRVASSSEITVTELAAAMAGADEARRAAKEREMEEFRLRKLRSARRREAPSPEPN